MILFFRMAYISSMFVRHNQPSINTQSINFILQGRGGPVDFWIPQKKGGIELIRERNQVGDSRMVVVIKMSQRRYAGRLAHN
jgi:hypothetical protein